MHSKIKTILTIPTIPYTRCLGKEQGEYWMVWSPKTIRCHSGPASGSSKASKAVGIEDLKKTYQKKLPLLNHILNPQQKNRSLAFNKHSIPCPPTSSQHFSQAPVGMAWCTKVPPFDIPLMAITPTTRHQRLANEKPAKVTRGTGIPTKKKGNDAFKP